MYLDRLQVPLMTPFVKFLQHLICTQALPSVVSFSESMPEDRFDAACAQQLCSMMVQARTKGVDAAA